MPYIVSTRKQFDTTGPRPLDHPADTEHAVATLQDAALYIDETTFVAHRPSQIVIPESGGTIGPLPDGTMIEVRRVSWGELRHARPMNHTSGSGDQAIIDVFNAR